jgi:histidyl-tRNA synthetase
VERLGLLLEVAGSTPAAARPVTVIPVGEVAEGPALDMVQALRRAGVVAEIGYKGNLKRRMERANKLGARAAVILGEDEIEKGVAQLRDLDAGTQEMVPLAEVAARLAPAARG